MSPDGRDDQHLPADHEEVTSSSSRSSSKTSASINTMPPAAIPSLTLEQAIELQNELIVGYMSIEFQEQLFTELGKVYKDELALARAGRKVRLPVQAPVLYRFGFEPTQKGVQDSLKAFRPYNHLQPCAARGRHMTYLIEPFQQDVLWKGQVRRRRDPETGLPDHTTLPPLLTVEQGVAIQSLLHEEYKQPHFREKLLAALAEAKGDEVQEVKARQQTCFPIQCRILPKFGFEPTAKGVQKSLKAFKPLGLYPEIHVGAKQLTEEVEHLRAPGEPYRKDKKPAVQEEAKQSGSFKVGERKTFSLVPGVGLNVCEGIRHEQPAFEVQETAYLKERPELLLPDDALLCNQFVIDAAYPLVLSKLSQMPTCAEDASPKGPSIQRDTDGRIFLFLSDGHTWMQELLSLIVPAQAGFVHRITILHTVSPTQEKRGVDQGLADTLWQRRLYSYKEMSEFFRFVPIEEGESERTLVWRAICSFETSSQDNMLDVKQQLADSLERDSRKWISHWSPGNFEVGYACKSASMAAPEDLRSLAAESKDFQLTREQAGDMVEQLILGYQRPAFQEKLHISTALASGESAEEKARVHQEVCMLVQGPVFERFGLPPTRLGLNKSLRAFRQHNDDPALIPRHMKCNYFARPDKQEAQYVEYVLSGFAQSSAPSYKALRLPELYRDDKELISLAMSGFAAQLRLRLQFKKAHPNIVGHTLTRFDAGIESFPYVVEKTPLIAAVENGQQAAFDVFMKFRPMVDINFVCFEWQIDRPYKRFTALDKALLSKHSGAGHILEQLILLGAKSAQELPMPLRESPFIKWKHHFPDAKFTNLEQEDIGHLKNVFEEEGVEGLRFWESFFEPAQNANQESLDSAPHRSASDLKGKNSARPWCWPPLPEELGKDIEGAIKHVKERLSHSCVSTIEDQQRLMKQLFLEWHPDKRLEDQHFATKVFQWLQELREKTF